MPFWLITHGVGMGGSAAATPDPPRYATGQIAATASTIAAFQNTASVIVTFEL